MQITVSTSAGDVMLNATLDAKASTALAARFTLDNKFPAGGTISTNSLKALNSHARTKLTVKFNVTDKPVKPQVCKKVVTLTWQ